MCVLFVWVGGCVTGFYTVGDISGQGSWRVQPVKYRQTDRQLEGLPC